MSIGGPSCKIIGCVVDQNNNPQQGLNIEWSPFGNDNFQSIATTDIEGNYETDISPIPPNPSEQTLKVMDQRSILTVNPGYTVTANFIL